MNSIIDWGTLSSLTNISLSVLGNWGRAPRIVSMVPDLQPLATWPTQRLLWAFLFFSKKLITRSCTRLDNTRTERRRAFILLLWLLPRLGRVGHSQCLVHLPTSGIALYEAHSHINPNTISMLQWRVFPPTYLNYVLCSTKSFPGKVGTTSQQCTHCPVSEFLAKVNVPVMIYEYHMDFTVHGCCTDFTNRSITTTRMTMIRGLLHPHKFYKIYTCSVWWIFFPLLSLWTFLFGSQKKRWRMASCNTASAFAKDFCATILESCSCYQHCSHRDCKWHWVLMSVITMEAVSPLYSLINGP